MRRKSDKTEGAFGKETVEQVEEKHLNRNLDKATANELTTGGSGGA